MKISNFNTVDRVFIIAEIGNNHEGNYSLAEEMIGLAARAGADAVKFQTIVPEKLVSVLHKDRVKQLNNFQLSYNEFSQLEKVAKNEKVIFFYPSNLTNLFLPFIGIFQIIKNMTIIINELRCF